MVKNLGILENCELYADGRKIVLNSKMSKKDYEIAKQSHPQLEWEEVKKGDK